MKKTQKRDELERAALNTAQRLGLKGLSFRTLAAEVGVKSSSVHYYFPEKADLAYSLIQRYREEFLAALDDIDKDTQKTSKAKLDSFIELFMQTACDDKMCLCGMMAAEVDQLDDKSRALLNRYFDDCVHWLTQLFDSSKSELKLPLAPDTLATALISALEGALLLDRAQGSTSHLRAQQQIAHSWLR